MTAKRSRRRATRTSKDTVSEFKKHVVDADRMITYAIASHLWIEHQLIRIIESRLPNSRALFRKRQPSFLFLVDLAEAFGEVESDFGNVLRKVNALRNGFAHRMLFKLNSGDIESLQKSLREMKKPFYMPFVPPSRRNWALALASICGHLEWIARGHGAKDIGTKEQGHDRFAKAQDTLRPKGTQKHETLKSRFFAD